MKSLSNENINSLRHLADLLHLFSHRNKNQHRRSIWWRHFSIYRKDLNRILQDHLALRETPTTHVERSKKKAKDQLTNLCLHRTLDHWRDVLVPKWQHAFSQVAADGRFAVLGLILLAALAESCRILSVTAALEELGQAEVEKVLRQFAQEEWGSLEERRILPGRGREDFGELVSRDPIGDVKPAAAANLALDECPATPVMDDRPSKRPLNITDEARPKKKQRKGNAIDDLFSGLG